MSSNILQESADTSHSNGYTFKSVNDRMEEDPVALGSLLAAIRIGEDNYLNLARRFFPHILNENDLDSTIRSGVSIIAAKYLTDAERKIFRSKVRYVFTSDVAKKAARASQESGNAKMEFNRDEQIKSALARGNRPWSDAEEMLVIVLAETYKLPISGRDLVDWQTVTDRMNAIFPDANLDRLICRRHGRGIFERHAEGRYKRGMPANHREALERALSSLMSDDVPKSPVTVKSITDIQCMLAQQPGANDSLDVLVKGIDAFMETVDLARIDDGVKRAAADFRSRLLERDSEVEAWGHAHLYARLTTIIDAKKGQFIELLSPR